LLLAQRLNGGPRRHQLPARQVILRVFSAHHGIRRRLYPTWNNYSRKGHLFQGASSEEAVRLAGLKNSTASEQESAEHDNEKADVDDEDEDDYLLEDDEFLDRYRQQRLEELQDEKSKLKGENIEFGEVVLISRDEWNRHVNEDSMKHWVVVCLTSSDTERTGRV
jgi:hypothetical protein